jgi:hypothetical protein
LLSLWASLGVRRKKSRHHLQRLRQQPPVGLAL